MDRVSVNHCNGEQHPSIRQWVGYAHRYVEFYKFFRQLGLFRFGTLGQHIFNELVTGNPGYMLLDQGILIHQKIEVVGG